MNKPRFRLLTITTDLAKPLIEEAMNDLKKSENDRLNGQGETTKTQLEQYSKKGRSEQTVSLHGSEWKTPKLAYQDAPAFRGRKAHELVEEHGGENYPGETTPITLALDLKLASQARFHVNGLFKSKIKEEQFRGKGNLTIVFLLESGTEVTAYYRERRTQKKYPTRVWILKWGSQMTGIDVSPVIIPVRVEKGGADVIVDYYSVNDLIKKGIVQTGDVWKTNDKLALRKYNLNI
jgi:hypothetical protein